MLYGSAVLVPSTTAGRFKPPDARDLHHIPWSKKRPPTHQTSRPFWAAWEAKLHRIWMCRSQLLPAVSMAILGGRVAQLESIADVVARRDLGTRRRTPVELSGPQLPGGARRNRLDVQFVERAVDRFVGQMSVRLPGKPLPQGLADLLRSPPLGQASHDGVAQLAVTGQFGESDSAGPALGYLLSQNG